MFIKKAYTFHNERFYRISLYKILSRQGKLCVLWPCKLSSGKTNILWTFERGAKNIISCRVNLYQTDTYTSVIAVYGFSFMNSSPLLELSSLLHKSNA